MDLITNIIETTLNSFDFGYCIMVNILTYLIIKVIDELNGVFKVGVWTKRGVLVAVLLSTGGLYYLFGNDPKLIINSAILAPVFWSWIMKPICIKFGIDYRDIEITK